MGKKQATTSTTVFALYVTTVTEELTYAFYECQKQVIGR